MFIRNIMACLFVLEWGNLNIFLKMLALLSLVILVLKV